MTPQSPPRIGITSFHPLISRNILSTVILALLKRCGVEVVLFVPAYKKAYFEKKYGESVYVIEGISTALPYRAILFQTIARAFSTTRGATIGRRVEYRRNKNLFSFLIDLSISNLGKLPGVVVLFRFLDRFLSVRAVIGVLLKKHNLTLVFSTDIQNEIDVHMLASAKKLGIPTVGMVRSWDNLTSKGIVRIVPDTLIAHNDIIKREAITLNNIAPSAIRVVGIPHYDRYVKARQDAHSSILKETFFLRHGLAPEKKLIVYAPIGNRYVPKNGLDQLVLDTLIQMPVNLLVRMPPTLEVNLNKTELMQNAVATVVFEETGEHPWKGEASRTHQLKDNELSSVDEQSLIDTLTYADVLVTGHSTISIDAALFDVPIVIIGFDEKKRHLLDSVRRYYEYEYYFSIIASGGVSVAQSTEELRKNVEQYCADRARNRHGRERIVREQLGVVDGHAAERLVAVLMKDI